MSGSAPKPAGPADRFFQFSVLALVASGYLAVAGSGYLDAPTAIVAGFALFTRLLMIAGVLNFDLSPRAATLLTLAYIAFYPVDYLWISRDFLTATVHLIFFLAVVKVLTARSSRDYFFLKMIAFMEMLAAAVLSNNINFFAFLALFLLFGVCTFAASEIGRSAQLPRRVSRIGSGRLQWSLAGMTISTAFGIMVLTATLFFLLPRTARAAFRHFGTQRYRLTGFSNEIELGGLGELQKSSAPVMHVKIDGADRPMSLKWRGAALAHFDGRRWFNPQQLGEPLRVEETLVRLANDRQQWRKGPRISYEVALQTSDSDALFFAGVPEFIRINAPVIYRMPTDSFRTGPGYADGGRYDAYSFLPDDRSDSGFIPEALPEGLKQSYLQLPAVDPRIAALTERLTAGTASDSAAAHAIENHLRTGYRYSTDMLTAEVPDPLANFLFERKQGYCEYFASAMAVMLRQTGIPARVVTGFQSGIYNPMTGWQVIRASDAHSWVEAYLQHRGWTTFDPTPPDNRLNASGLLARLALFADTADTFWQEWVLNYNRDRQFDLALRLDSSSRSLRLGWAERTQQLLKEAGRQWLESAIRYGPVLAGMTAVVFLVVFAWSPVRELFGRRRYSQRLARGEATPHDATVLYRRLLAVLRKRGFDKPAWLTPAEFAGVLPRSADSLAVEDLTEAYQRLRYGGDRSVVARMVDLLARIEQGEPRR